MSWDLILPFLRPLEPFLLDPDVSDILVNGTRVFVEKQGRLQAVPEVTINERFLYVAVRNIARVLGDNVSPDQPLLDARLPDGSRVAAVLAPCSVNGTTLAIRKFHSERFSAERLVGCRFITAGAMEALRRAVENRRNILISGGTGTGKTTLLSALAGLIPDEERIVVIEDTSEIRLVVSNLVRLEARREQPGIAPVTPRDLLRTTLRLRPDRILLGEVRGGEAFDLLQALNSGHSGALSTLHANSAAQAMARFTSCVLMSGIELPYQAIRTQIAAALDLLVHIARTRQGERRVTEIVSVKGYNRERDQYDLETLYERA